MPEEARPGAATPEDRPEPEGERSEAAGVPGAPPYTEPQQPRADAQPEDMTIGELVLDVSDKTSTLIREEIELARAEVTEKVTRLLRGSVVGIVAGVFAFLALILFMIGIAWLLNDLVFDDRTWPGFLVEGAVFLLIGGIAALYAYRAVRSGAPPTPEMAIEEAKRTRTELEGER